MLHQLRLHPFLSGASLQCGNHLLTTSMKKSETRHQDSMMMNVVASSATGALVRHVGAKIVVSSSACGSDPQATVDDPPMSGHWADEPSGLPETTLAGSTERPSAASVPFTTLRGRLHQRWHQQAMRRPTNKGSPTYGLFALLSFALRVYCAYFTYVLCQDHAFRS